MTSHLVVYAEQYISGEAVTIFSCCYCDSLFYLSQPEIDQLKPPEEEKSTSVALRHEIFKRLRAAKEASVIAPGETLVEKYFT